VLELAIMAVGAYCHNIGRCCKMIKINSKCSICNCSLPLKIMGHNAEPVAPGVCCVICNYTVVIPERLRMIEDAS
jgi:hypothetical protein